MHQQPSVCRDELLRICFLCVRSISIISSRTYLIIGREQSLKPVHSHCGTICPDFPLSLLFFLDIGDGSLHYDEPCVSKCKTANK